MSREFSEEEEELEEEEEEEELRGWEREREDDGCDGGATGDVL